MRKNDSLRKRDGARPSWWMLMAISLSTTAILCAHFGAGSESRRSNPSKTVTSSLQDPPARSYWSSGALMDTAGRSKAFDSGQGDELPARLPSPTTQTTQGAEAVPTQTPEGPTTYPGYLSYPDNVTTSLPLPNQARAVSASVTWQGTESLGIAIECPSGEHSAVGTSSAVSISADLVGSPCQLVLTEVSQASQPVPYLLSLNVTSSA